MCFNLCLTLIAVYFLENYPSLSDLADTTSEQTIATMAQRNQGDGEEVAAAPAIACNVLRRLVMAVTQAITATIANAMVSFPFTPKNIAYSSAINLYHDKSFETNMKEGKYQWHLTTKTAKGWGKYGISATV